MISVIIPVHNGAAFLDECISSILSQSYENFELVVIDDGSTDDSARIVADYAAADARVHLFSQSQAGVSQARNRGIDESRGEYLCFVDADDRMRPDGLEVLLVWASRFSADVVFARHCCFTWCVDSDKGSQWGRRASLGRVRSLGGPRHRFMNQAMSSRRAFREFARGRIQGAVWAGLWRREFLGHDLRFPRGRRHEDVTFIAEALLRANCTVCIPDCVYEYRMWPGSFMNSLSPDRLDGFWARAEVSRLTRQHISSAGVQFQQTAGYILTAASVIRSIGFQNPPREEIPHWRAQVYSRVSRWFILCTILHPLCPLKARVHGLLLLAGIRPYLWGFVSLQPVLFLSREIVIRLSQFGSPRDPELRSRSNHPRFSSGHPELDDHPRLSDG